MKKILSFLIAIIICFTQAVSAEEHIGLVIDPPQITFVGIGHSPLVEGDTENFIITSQCDLGLKVQYRIFLEDVDTKISKELTEGYSELVSPVVPYEINPSHVFTKGKYRLKVWIRAEGRTNNYDNTYIANLNCVAKDDKNRVYVNGDMDIKKTTYNVGEKVVIKGIKNIGGIGGVYLYRLHIFSPNKIGDEGFGFDKKGWAKNVTRYENTIEWTPMEAGTYILDVHAITPKSTLWKKVKANKDIIYGGYEAWKLKTITVVGEPLKSMKEEDIIEFTGNMGNNDYKGNINPAEFKDENGKIYMNLFGSQHYDAVNGKTAYKTVLPIETYNKDINKQTYSLIKSLVDRECHISSGVNRLDLENLGSYVDITLEDKLLGNRMFKYIMYEKSDKYVPSGTKISLYITQLSLSNNWNDIATTTLKNKFEISLKSLYGKETGFKIYNYILGDYISYKSSSKVYTKLVTIDNVKINISTKHIYDVSFIF